MAKRPLPDIMVAPNGARRTQSDHPAIPITDAELIQTAQACFAAGAEGLHAHLRDANGRHLLDAGRYCALIDQLSEAVPGMYIQITSEAAGRYDAATQQQLIRDIRPDNVSVALREMVRSQADWTTACAFYEFAADHGVDVQHIVYSLDELNQFIRACEAQKIPGTDHSVQLVLGAYDGTQKSAPRDVAALVIRMQASDHSFDWMLCAFGVEETACLVETARLGGKVRVGFENSLWHADGSLARDNAARVTEVRREIAAATR